MIPIPSPGVPLAYGGQGSPLVLVLPDAYGRLPWLEHYAAAMADRGGLRVLVLDPYGVATTDPDEADRLAAGLAGDGARALLAAAAAEHGGGASRTGVVGFGSGGVLALRAAQRGEADAVVAYDAVLAEDAPGILPCPVQLHLAESDPALPEDAAAAFQERVRADGTPITVHRYVGTSRGFANATVSEHLDARAAALAFARATMFLQRRLAD